MKSLVWFLFLGHVNAETIQVDWPPDGALPPGDVFTNNFTKIIIDASVGDTIIWNINGTLGGEGSTYRVIPSLGVFLPFSGIDAYGSESLENGSTYSTVVVIDGNYTVRGKYEFTPYGSDFGLVDWAEIRVELLNSVLPIKNIIESLTPDQCDANEESNYCFLPYHHNLEGIWDMENWLYDGNAVETTDSWANSSCDFNASTIPSTNIPNATGWNVWDWDDYIDDYCGWVLCGSLSQCNYPCQTSTFDSSNTSNVRDYMKFLVEQSTGETVTDLTNVNTSSKHPAKYMLQILENSSSQVYFNGVKVDIPAPNGTTAQKVNWRLNYCTVPGNASTIVSTVLFGQKSNDVLTYSTDNSAAYYFPGEGLDSRLGMDYHMGINFISDDAVTLNSEFQYMCPYDQQYVYELESCQPCINWCVKDMFDLFVGHSQSPGFISYTHGIVVEALDTKNYTGITIIGISNLTHERNKIIIQYSVMVNCSNWDATTLTWFQYAFNHLSYLSLGSGGGSGFHFTITPYFRIVVELDTNVCSGGDGEVETKLNATMIPQVIEYPNATTHFILWPNTTGGCNTTECQPPWNITISVGDIVEWQNDIGGNSGIGIMSDTAAFPGVMSMNYTHAVGFHEEGVFPYHNPGREFDPQFLSMIGVITVTCEPPGCTPPSPPPSPPPTNPDTTTEPPEVGDTESDTSSGLGTAAIAGISVGGVVVLVLVYSYWPSAGIMHATSGYHIGKLVF